MEDALPLGGLQWLNNIINRINFYFVNAFLLCLKANEEINA